MNGVKSLYAIEVEQLKTLHQLAVERGFTPPVTLEEISLVTSDETLSEQDRIRWVNTIHRLIHEILYSPPGR